MGRVSPKGSPIPFNDMQWVTAVTAALQEYMMLYSIAVVLVLLWLVGLISSYTIGGFIHILVVVAVVMVLVRLITGRKIL